MKTATRWVCSNCGRQESKWMGSCSSCNEWNTFEQESFSKPKASLKEEPMLIKDIPLKSFEKRLSGFQEFDRILGGGVVKGALTLIGGSPGIGKSTLLLQAANLYAKKGHKVLYVTGEESKEQTSLRARRIGALSDNLYLLSETAFSSIELVVQSMKPEFLFIDSIQILHKEEIPSSPGSVLQVKELAMSFMQIAKTLSITTFLIGHVTKSGDLAGPRVLEHLMDTVLDLEGEKTHGFRLLRSIKNRFGPTDDVAIFSMHEEGLKEVENPSKIFLEERAHSSYGSSVSATIEGKRAFLVEAQALVTKSFLPAPTRKSTGIDQNRLSLLLAVLEKQMGYQMHSNDVFVSLTGGIKVKEPAIDLAVICALSSSLLKKALSQHTVFLGEVGLSGEIRSCPSVENRLKEALHLGFTRALIPKKNLRHLGKKWQGKMNILGVDCVQKGIEFMQG